MSQGKIMGETKLRDDDSRKCDQPGCDRKAAVKLERLLPDGHVEHVCSCGPHLRWLGQNKVGS